MHSENITIGSGHIDLGSSFREDATNRIRDLAHKYLGSDVIASSHLAREGASFRCSVTINMGEGHQATAEAIADSVPMAFQAALNKVATQLRRTKRLHTHVVSDRPDRIISA